MLENKVATGLKVSAILIALAIVHGIGNFLGNIFLLSDIFTVLGAYQVYRLLTNSEAREDALDTVADAIDLDETADYLVAKGVELAGNLGVAAAENITTDDLFGNGFFVADEDEDEDEYDTLAQ